MAENGPCGSRRSFLFILLASVLTLGVYWIYWYYKTNSEIKEYGRMGHSPGIRLLMLLFGWVLLAIPTIYAYYAWLRDVDGLAKRVGVSGLSPIGNTILLFVPLGSLYTTYKVQSVLNSIWASDSGCSGAIGNLERAPSPETASNILLVCPKCKTRNPEENNYCKKCGEKLGG
ncbi:MAG: DUF4234 domain-containing protein [Candidatus Micrarchaeota archaeon]|nr:DUF4234 domain-containing protein [Candidatus Micrarchaeota archaeon]